MYELRLSEQQLSTVLEALSRMPLGAALDTFISIRQQAAQQQKPAKNGAELGVEQ